MAGLTARYYLEVAGLPTETFDKGRGPGGRTSRRREGSYEFDHGAQYFTVRDPVFRDLVHGWISDGTVQEWKPRIGTLRQGTWVEQPGGPRYVGVPGMNQPAKNLARMGDEIGAHPVRLSCRIVEARKRSATASVGGGDAWYLRDAEGAVYGPYGDLVVTVPPPQAAALLPPSSAALPLVQEVRIDPCWAVMAVFRETVKVHWDAAFVDGGALSWAARNSSKPGRSEGNMWVLHGSPRWSRENLEMEPEEVKRALTGEFLAAAGHRSEPSSLCVWSAAHRWRYARPHGAAPGAPERVDSPRRPFWWSDDERLGLSGDWFLGGRVESAFLSGRSLGTAFGAAPGWRTCSTD